MSFEARVIAFGERFLSDRAFQLIVLPALADLQFEDPEGSFTRTARRLGVLRAVAGALRDDLARDSHTLLTLMFVPACYYVFALILCFDVLKISLSTGFFVTTALIVILSVGQALVCFWPARQTARPVE
jgi:hypothetical protein